jgi:hypothetical protein
MGLSETAPRSSGRPASGPAGESVTRWPSLESACVALVVFLAVPGADAAPERHAQGGFEFFVDAAPAWVKRTTLAPTAAPAAGQAGR